MAGNGKSPWFLCRKYILNITSSILVHQPTSVKIPCLYPVKSPLNHLDFLGLSGPGSGGSLCQGYGTLPQRPGPGKMKGFFSPKDMVVFFNGGSTPPQKKKMIIFSRKTHGFVGETHHFRKQLQCLGMVECICLGVLLSSGLVTLVICWMTFPTQEKHWWKE